VRAARSAALETRAEAEGIARQALTTLEQLEQRLVTREERLDARLDNAMTREASITAREAKQAERAVIAEQRLAEQTEALEQIRALPPDVARQTLLEHVAPSARDRATAQA